MARQVPPEENKQAKNAIPRSDLIQRICTTGTAIFVVLSKNPVKMISHITITMAFVYIVNRNIKFTDMQHLVKSINLLQCSCAFIFGAISLFFQLLRWRIILVAHRLPAGIAVASKTMFRGFLLAFLTPGRLGELFRAMDLDTTRKTDTLLAVAEERLCAIVTIVIGGIISGAGIAVLYSSHVFKPLLIAGFIFSVCLSVIITFILRNESLFIRKFSSHKWLSWVPAGIQRWKHLPILPLAAYSIGAYFFLLLQTSTLFNMLGKIDLIRGILISGQAYAFMLLLPFFIANIGLREYAFSLFLTKNSDYLLPIAASNTVSFGTATLILFFNILVPAAVGIVWMYIQKQPDRYAVASNPSILECNRNDFQKTEQ